jgi:hypothetical protein
MADCPSDPQSLLHDTARDGVNRTRRFPRTRRLPCRSRRRARKWVGAAVLAVDRPRARFGATAVTVRLPEATARDRIRSRARCQHLHRAEAGACGHRGHPLMDWNAVSTCGTRRSCRSSCWHGRWRSDARLAMCVRNRQDRKLLVKKTLSASNATAVEVTRCYNLGEREWPSHSL